MSRRGACSISVLPAQMPASAKDNVLRPWSMWAIAHAVAESKASCSEQRPWLRVSETGRLCSP